MAKKLGMNPCPEAIDYLYERYYNARPDARGPAIAAIYWRRCSRFADLEEYLSS